MTGRGRARDERIFTEGDRSAAGGLVTTVAPDKLEGGLDRPKSQFSWAANMFPAASGAWKKRRGYTLLHQFSDRILAIRRFAGGVLVWYNGAIGELVPHQLHGIVAFRSSTGTITLLGSCERDGHIVHEEYHDAVWFSDGSTNLSSISIVNGVPTRTDHTVAHRFAYLARSVGADRMFGIEWGDRGNVRWSDPFNAAVWGPASVLSPGGDFTALIEIGRVMVLAQADRMYRIDGTDPATWEVTSVGAEGLGCIAPRTMVEVEGVAVYYSPRGLTFFDGSRARPLSGAIFAPDGGASSMFPTTAAWAEDGFAMVTREHVNLCFRTWPDWAHNHNVVPYAFREDVFGGRYWFRFTLTCGDGGTDGMIFGCHDGSVAVETDGVYTDLGFEYDVSVATRAYTFGTVTLDKIWREARLAYTVGGDGANVGVLLVPDDTVAVWLETQRPLQRGAHVLKVAITPGYRSKFAILETEYFGPHAFELSEWQVDAFFGRAR